MARKGFKFPTLRSFVSWTQAIAALLNPLQALAGGRGGGGGGGGEGGGGMGMPQAAAMNGMIRGGIDGRRE
jgi:hypothetical protein